MNDRQLDKEIAMLFSDDAGYINDSGFADTVLGSLPRRRPVRLLQHYLIISLSICLAAAVAILVPGLVRQVGMALIDVTTSVAYVHLPALSSLIIVGIICWGMIAALRSMMAEANG